MTISHPSPAPTRGQIDKNILMKVEETPADERTTHEAQCHCGAVKYDVTLNRPFPKYPVNRCNCTICTQLGYLLVYPSRQDVIFHQGYDNLGSYAFNTKTKSHRFCKSCGTSIMIDFQRNLQGETDPAKDILAVNVRNFKDIDLEAMEYTYFDGRKLL